jgi:methylated-DNA-[protein]-cysteine S-methyltransferase
MRGAIQNLPAGAAIGCVNSPLGPFTAICSSAGLLAVRYPSSPSLAAPGAPDAVASKLLELTLGELRGYFLGSLRAFSVPLDLRGTLFQQSVWEAVRGVPYGEIRGYGELAGALGRPAAARAVGHANGSNPLPIVVPCHRLVGADGALRGYGGGLPIKRWLLDHERRTVAMNPDRS